MAVAKHLAFPILLTASFVLLMNGGLKAQHEHHHADTLSQPEPVVVSKAGHDDVMNHSFSLNLPMNRNGSGTGWIPDASPMYGYMIHSRKWMYMIHGNIFIRYNAQDIGSKGTRGDSKVDAPNWFMFMGQRRIGKKGLFHFNTMFSLDPLFGGEGYPLLFQTGETFKGEPLVDRQHPHNLFSELSIAYTRSFTNQIDAFVYLGYPGEPALGPVAFMHRPSSLNNPDSPLGHHWQDATHITFGVATVGFRYKIFKLDGSVFTGREPGEARYGFDRATFDSYSYRLTANPSPSWSLQVSRAFLNGPEAIHPETNVERTTASVTHALPMAGVNHSLTSVMVWGYNNSGEGHREHSLTFEANLQLDRTAIYGRYENIQKSADELLLYEFDEHALFSINAVTLGLNYIVLRELNTNLALGGHATFYHTDSALDSVYGNGPFSAQIYLRISPAVMTVQ